MNIYDVAVIGAGPAGLMTSIQAAKKNKSVLLIEKNKKIGQKILATGNGRCNITNSKIETRRYHGASADFVLDVINAFDENKTIRFFEKLGLVLKEEDRGRMFPRTNQAFSVVEALKHELEEKNIKIITEQAVRHVNNNENGFLLTLENNVTILTKHLAITTGGKAAPQFGSSGDGFFWAQKLGHTVTPIYPALVPIETKENWVKDIQGLKIEGNITIKSNNKVVAIKNGDILFTHFGLSGPAVMSIARNVGPLIKEKIDAEIFIDTIPEETEGSLDEKLAAIFNTNGAKFIKNALSDVVAFNIIPIILAQAKVDLNKKAAAIGKKERQEIVHALKSLKLTPKTIRPFKEAQVTAGGINADEINSHTLESKIVPGLYFAGEIINVDGDSGGFNLQWAWSSGFVAGSNI